MAPSNEKLNCSMDGTTVMQPCFQATQAWCWATSISELAFFYNTTSRTEECAAIECAVVSTDLKQQCCPKGASMKCDWHGARDATEIARTANAFIPGRNFVAVDEPLSEKELVAVLMAGNPLVMGMQWQGSSGGHAKAIGGCRAGAFGSVEYAVHDPESKSWEWHPYQMVLKDGYLTWVNTVYDYSHAMPLAHS